MSGYEQISQYFTSNKQKNLEGIAWNPSTQTLFAVKEGFPGLILEITADLDSILAFKLLRAKDGFWDMEVDEQSLDFSGIAYDTDDPTRNLLWLVSDKAERLFLYDWDDNRVVRSFTLGYSNEGEYKAVRQAEGVAVDRPNGKIYVVSDRSPVVYIFDVRE